MISSGQGFLLTRSSYDRRGTTEIEYWVATEAGPVRLLISGERPICFIKEGDLTQAAQCLGVMAAKVELTLLDLCSFSHERMVGVYTATINDQFTVIDLLQHAGIEVLEADFRLHDRFLMERFVCGGVAFVGEFSANSRFSEIRRCQIKPSEYRPVLSYLSLDIECAMDESLFSVGLSDGATVNEVLMIGEQEPCEHTTILWFNDEASMLHGLVERICRIDPDVIIGWNLVNFDMRILLTRAGELGVPFTIGRAQRKAIWRDARGDPGKGFISIPGRLAIDGIDALRSATWSFSSFSLEHVSQTLLSRGKKVAQDVDDRLAEILHNFEHNKTALAAYNLEDCRLVVDIFLHTGILNYLVLRSQLTGLELDRAGGSVAAFTNLYLPRLHRAGYVAPNLPGDGGLASPGGYVMDSTPGLYRNVLVLDFKSLYPAIIRTFKIDPLGLIEGLKNSEKAVPGFRGGLFHREKHFLPSIITQLWKQRDQAKQEGNKVRSQAIKILMNSFYGVLGSGGCRFYDTRLASSITMRGHEIMQTTRKWIEAEGYKVIYGDTDSTFVALDEFLNQSQCRTIGANLALHINQLWQQYIRQHFDLDCFLEIEFETYFSRFLMPTIRGSEAGSKKRYAGLLAAGTGGSEEIVFKGLENVRTDWTSLAKDFQAELFNQVFHDQDPSELVKTTVDRTIQGGMDQHLVYRKQLRRKLSSYVKNVPPHVRAARLADQQNKVAGKILRYQNKGWISYVMTVNGPEPVEYRSSPIDYDHYIDKQLKPVADAVLPFIGLNFDSITSAQTELF